MLVFGGQSSGVGVATTAAAAYLARSSFKKGITLKKEIKRVQINVLLIETPFTSVRAMLVALYPQKWLIVSVHPFFLVESMG